MEDNFKLENCHQDEVLAFRYKVFKIAQIQEAIEKVFCEELSQQLYDSLYCHGLQIEPGGEYIRNQFCRHNNKWFDGGIECEILKIPSKGWQPGRFRLKVTLEFIPEAIENNETES